MKSGLLSSILLVWALWTPNTAALDCFDCSDATNCATKPEATKACATEGLACYVSIDGNTVTRGCKAKADCTGDSCVSCDGDKCNNNLICKACAGGIDCAKKDGSVGIKVCAAGITNCYTQINSEKQTERGCADTALVDKCTGETCAKCTVGLCNTDIVPADRLVCNQCTASADCNQLKDVTASACLNYVKDDKCYTYGTSADTMTRGCVSDKDPKCTTNNENCLVCAAGSCNNRNFERDQKLKCIKCESKTDTKCANSPSTSDLKACDKPIKFVAEDTCYTQINEDVSRGCFYDKFDKTSDCAADKGCEPCNTADACNKESAVFQCILCRSDELPTCWDEADKIESGVECTNKTEPQKCFHRVKDGVAIRGCLNDASPQVQAQCESQDFCEVCSERKCNIKKSGASSIMVTNSFLIMAIVALKRFF